ncbi:MAG: hypothetical protein KJ604_20570, partial [Gammaproteobacteria bacterium]|nr:hypothetical protein [Gammaproteobacteria bacterium]
MNMDLSEQYIKMCREAGEIQFYKWGEGFQESDMVYENVVIRGKEHVHVLGHDYIVLKTYFDNGFPVVKYALL